MAAAIVILLAVDTALTGWLLAKVSASRKLTDELLEQCAGMQHEIDFVTERLPDVWEGARG